MLCMYKAHIGCVSPLAGDDDFGKISILNKNRLKMKKFSQSVLGRIMSVDSDEVLSIKEVAAALRCTERRAYLLVLRGGIPSFRIHPKHGIRVYGADLKDWI